MKMVDFHVHSQYSFDGKDTMENICRQAISLQMREICFTEHFDVDPQDVSYGALNYRIYAQAIEKCRERYQGCLKIRRGLEIGEPHLKAYASDLQAALRGMDLDFIIGSVHNLGSIKLRLTLPNRDKHTVYQAYFDEVLQMVASADIDVAGHLDLMKRYAYEQYGNYSFEDFKDILQAILQTMIARKIGLEVNTSGFRDRVGEAYPSLAILQLYKALGGRYITIGSDAHHHKDLGSYWQEGILLLKEAGFSTVFVYEKRIPQEYLLE